jgi:Fe-S-cluster containining protein
MLKVLAGQGIVEKMDGHKCKHLWFKKRKARCKIYKDRPEFCKLYPNVPSDLIEGCGFRFKAQNPVG